MGSRKAVHTPDDRRARIPPKLFPALPAFSA